jgi:hypothetical protein
MTLKNVSIALAATVAAIAVCATAPAQTRWPKRHTSVGLKADSNEVAVEGLKRGSGSRRSVGRRR